MNHTIEHQSGDDKSRQTLLKLGGVTLSGLIGYGLYATDAISSFGSENHKRPAAADAAQKDKASKTQLKKPATPNHTKKPMGTPAPRVEITNSTNELKDGSRALTEKPYTRSGEIKEMEQDQELRQEAIRKGRKGKGQENQEPEVQFEPLD